MTQHTSDRPDSPSPSAIRQAGENGAKRAFDLTRFYLGVFRFRLAEGRKKLADRFWAVFLPSNRRLGLFLQHVPADVRFSRLPAPRCSEDRLPALAIVTPTFNQAPFLEQTMRSVLDNGHASVSYAVVDGASRDGTVSIIEKYRSRLAYWVSEPDRGQGHAIQKGFEHVTGDIMGYLNSDDILVPGALRLVAAYFARHPDVDVVYGHRIVINEEGFEIGRWILPPHSNESTRREDFIPQETLFWRKEIYERAGGIDTSFQFAMDWDLILRFQKAGARIRRLPYFLGCFRHHAQQKTSSLGRSVGDAEVERLRLRELGADRTKWKVMDHMKTMKRRAVLTEMAARVGLRSTRF